MTWDLIFWVICFFLCLPLFASAFYQLYCLVGVEADYLNPYDASARINRVVVPELVLQGSLAALFLLTWHWLMFLVVFPLTYYHVRLYMEQRHLVDVTEVFRNLSFEKNLRMYKLVFYLSLFVLVIVRLTWSAFCAASGERHFIDLF